MADLVGLETSIKDLPGVLGCVILTDSSGDPSEIQAFTHAGKDLKAVQQQIESEVASRGLSTNLKHIYVFELEAESHFGDRETLERAAELAEQDARMRGPRGPEEDLLSLHTVVTDVGPATRERPPLLRVTFTSSSLSSQAEVALGSESDELVGSASGEKTPHGLKVLAEATLGAVARLLGDDTTSLLGASIVNIVGEEAVLVLVKEQNGAEMLGAALIRGGPVTEAAVRATLDAVNRRLARA
ncbi:MAG TPA: hypothetical protein VG408_04295 [Actinomycetota bacterium]|nr:hypothetical protein [Actinomycetota bacterium]